MGRIYDIQPGDIYGRLTVIGKVEDAIDPKSKKHMAQFLCRCSCPYKTLIVVKGKNLSSGHVQSCGCLLRENAKALHTGRPAVHPEYIPAEVEPNVICAYYTMMYESTNGIDSICTGQIPVYGKWMNGDIKDFYNTFASSYIDNNQKIKRIDSSIGFRPDNCFWGTRSNNSNDLINDSFIEYNGSNMTIGEWNMALGYNPNTIRDRIINGYSYEDAIMGKLDDMEPINAIYFVNDYGRPLNKKAIEESFY